MVTDGRGGAHQVRHILNCPYRRAVQAALSRPFQVVIPPLSLHARLRFLAGMLAFEEHSAAEQTVHIFFVIFISRSPARFCTSQGGAVQSLAPANLRLSCVRTGARRPPASWCVALASAYVNLHLDHRLLLSDVVLTLACKHRASIWRPGAVTRRSTAQLRRARMCI